MNSAGTASDDSTPHSTRSPPRPELPEAGDPTAIPEPDVARVQRWCTARGPNTSATKSASSATCPATSPSSSANSGATASAARRLKFAASHMTWSAT